MRRILITAFEPYGPWASNASQLAVALLVKLYRGPAELVVREYPVDFEQLEPLLRNDLDESIDAAILTGQSSRADSIELEAVALNVRNETDEPSGPFAELVAGGALARQTTLPLEAWCHALNACNIPAVVSHHAGTFLCNAAYYHALGVSELGRYTAPIGFVHFPLTPDQTPQPKQQGAALPTGTSAQALEIMIDRLLERI